MEKYFEDCDSSKLLIEKLIENRNLFKIVDSDKSVSESDLQLAINKIEELIRIESEGKCKILLRGETKSNLKEVMGEHINSNNSINDGIFLVGQKAKNFLKKESKMKNPIKHINSKDKSVANWIYDEYIRLVQHHSIIEKFKKIEKQKFINHLTGNQKYIDYYLFGLHTSKGGREVNFVSATESPETAYHDGIKKVIILFWIPQGEEYYETYYNSTKLQSIKKELVELDMPIIEDSFYPTERETSIKGFIIPNFIFGYIDCDELKVYLNTGLIAENSHWITEGFMVDELKFKDFIRSTKYKRYVSLFNNLYEENSISE